MSSHYIVREDQAPALVIYHSSAVGEHIIMSLLEWNPRVIVDESSLGFILHNRINVDAVMLNRMNPAELDELLGYQKPYDIFHAGEVPVKLIHYLAQKSVKAVDLIGEFDVAVMKLAQEMESRFPVYVYSEYTKFVHLHKGLFRKWSSPGRGFSVTPDHKDIQVINLDKVGSGSYRVSKEGIIEIKSARPVWIGEIIA